MVGRMNKSVRMMITMIEALMLSLIPMVCYADDLGWMGEGRGDGGAFSAMTSSFQSLFASFLVLVMMIVAAILVIYTIIRAVQLVAGNRMTVDEAKSGLLRIVIGTILAFGAIRIVELLIDVSDGMFI